jgi:hypothetical protein
LIRLFDLLGRAKHLSKQAIRVTPAEPQVGPLR